MPNQLLRHSDTSQDPGALPNQDGIHLRMCINCILFQLANGPSSAPFPLVLSRRQPEIGGVQTVTSSACSNALLPRPVSPYADDHSFPNFCSLCSELDINPLMFSMINLLFLLFCTSPNNVVKTGCLADESHDRNDSLWRV